MAYRADLPLVVQSDRSLLLEVDSKGYESCRDALTSFCELLKSPEHVHTYRITPVSIWNAAALGVTADDMVATLERFSRFDLPKNVVRDVRDLHARFGRLRLVPSAEAGRLELVSDDPLRLEEVAANPTSRDLVRREPDGRVSVSDENRGEVKRALVRQGWPVEDLAGYVDGGPLEVALRSRTPEGTPFSVRDYQSRAVDAFLKGGSVLGGNGVVVLPCGAGKTVVGIEAIARLRRKTLVLTTNHTAVVQWRRELLSKTDLAPEDVGEYTGEAKEIRPVTIATYQILTHRRTKTDPFTHFDLFSRNDWGLVVYDEVHLLPAPVFRVTARIQATRRLGLTATLLREDGREDDVFSLIGPKRYDVPWKSLERTGFIAEATCTEVRVPLEDDGKGRYALADRRTRFRIAAENPAKVDVLERLLALHRGEPILVIGQYLDQISRIARRIGAPLLSGATPPEERRELYDSFRAGRTPVLVVSKVGNFAVDLPEASVLVQTSGAFGSRQEEAQRLGRVLRPKADGRRARFYTLVSSETSEETFAQHRQLFLTEQGYAYEIVTPSEVAALAPRLSRAAGDR